METIPLFNEMQEDFIQWNAERLGISRQVARKRFQASVEQFPGGHSGARFRKFISASYNAFAPFTTDEDDDLRAVYQFHDPMEFLRMLSYSYCPVAYAEEIVRDLAARDEEISIIDYGCGLAHGAFWFAKQLAVRNIAVHLNLVDFPTSRKDFLIWRCAQLGLNVTFFDADNAGPVEGLPVSQLCIATDFFEHVRKPWRYFDAIDGAMDRGAWLVTDIRDQAQGFEHVSPDLAHLRTFIAEAGYVHFDENRVLFKDVPLTDEEPGEFTLKWA